MTADTLIQGQRSRSQRDITDDTDSPGKYLGFCYLLNALRGRYDISGSAGYKVEIAKTLLHCIVSRTRSHQDHCEKSQSLAQRGGKIVVIAGDVWTRVSPSDWHTDVSGAVSRQLMSLAHPPTLRLGWSRPHLSKRVTWIHKWHAKGWIGGVDPMEYAHDWRKQISIDSGTDLEFWTAV